MALGSLARHMQTQYGRAAEGESSWSATSPVEEPLMYRMAFPTVGGPRNFPVEVFLGFAVMRTAMWVHFIHWHVQDTMVILEEGNLPHPQCPQCDILVP